MIQYPSLHLELRTQKPKQNLVVYPKLQIHLAHIHNPVNTAIKSKVMFIKIPEKQINL